MEKNLKYLGGFPIEKFLNANERLPETNNFQGQRLSASELMNRKDIRKNNCPTIYFSFLNSPVNARYLKN